MQHEGIALAPEYVEAINRAFGARGEFKPLIKGERTDGVSSVDAGIEDGDLPILP
jgi:hypothetical protein